MAGISKKKYIKGGKEITRYVITYRDLYGKQHTSGNYATEKEAKANLSKFQEIKINSKNDAALGELIEIFMKKVRRKYAKNTVKAYESYINQYLKPLLGIKYNRLNSLMLQELFDNWEKEKAYTAHNVLLFCKGAINYCIEKKIISKYNVFNDLDDIKRPPKNLNHLELDEILKVLQKCEILFPEYYVMVFLILGGGLRIGEVIALEKTDFYYSYIKINKQYTAEELVFHPKTDKSNRDVYLFELLSEAIEAHIQLLPKDTKLLFPNKAGNFINPSNFRNRVWKPLLKQCGINKRVRLHDARGSYIDLLLAHGISGKFTQNQVGHEDWGTTYNEYSQNNKDGISNAIAKLNELFTKKCEHNVSISENSKVISLTERLAKTRTKKEPFGS